MNYDDFLIFKNNILNESPHLINMAENNLYKYRPSLLSYDNTGHINNLVYRCHLVEDWLNFYQLPQTLKSKIGVSNGIRQSLSLISQFFSNNKFLIPKDVYPFYQKLFIQQNISFNEYNTLHNNELFNNLNSFDSDILLITDPLKPLGRDILPSEYQNIHSWLTQNKNRILIVDCAYHLDNKLNSYLLNLYLNTNQVILLYSLSKGWSLPNCFGISLFMNNDLGYQLRESFKLLEKNQHNLNLAYMALNKNLNSLTELKNILYINHKKAELLLNRNLPYSHNNISYLYFLNEDFNSLLDKNILSIPASVFGGNYGSVISTLLTI